MVPTSRHEKRRYRDIAALPARLFRISRSCLRRHPANAPAEQHYTDAAEPVKQIGHLHWIIAVRIVVVRPLVHPFEKCSRIEGLIEGLIEAARAVSTGGMQRTPAAVLALASVSGTSSWFSRSRRCPLMVGYS